PTEKMHMVYLVTGASGFTGRHLALALSRRGHRVRGLVRDKKRARDLATAGIELVEGDLAEPETLIAAARGCSKVFHIAAMYREAGHPYEIYWKANAHGVAHLLDAAERCGVQRVVHCSTVGAHGDVKGPPDDLAA